MLLKVMYSCVQSDLMEDPNQVESARLQNVLNSKELTREIGIQEYFHLRKMYNNLLNSEESTNEIGLTYDHNRPEQNTFEGRLRTIEWRFLTGDVKRDFVFANTVKSILLGL
jgi:hypothetical protein